MKKEAKKSFRFTGIIVSMVAAMLAFSSPMMAPLKAEAATIPMETIYGEPFDQTDQVLLEAAVASGIRQKYQGKTFSILGDSICTYQGYLPQYYKSHYPRLDMNNVRLTWWARLANATGMRVLSNASWTGTTLTGDSDSMEGIPGCSIGRLYALFGYTPTQVIAPDYVFIKMGGNDMNWNDPPGEYHTGKQLPVTGGDIDSFSTAYQLTLARIRAAMPNTKIIVLTCLPWTDLDTGLEHHNDIGLTIDAYNDIARKIAPDYGATVIDLYHCGLNPSTAAQLTQDGVHPNAAGTALMAAYILMNLP